MKEFPVSFKDPAYALIDDAVQRRLGLPTGLLPAVRTRGERSNHDQVSSANARTVYQIIPATREAALKKWGVDAYLSPENAAEVAGRLLKDSLDRNGGDAKTAVAEYVGGTDRKAWGPETKAYVKRVTGALPSTEPDPVSKPPAPGGSTFDRAMAASDPDKGKTSVAKVFEAYQTGKMTPEDAAAFESEVKANRILLPRGSELKASANPPPAGAAPGASDKTVPLPVLQAFVDGKMSEKDAADFRKLYAAGEITIPPELLSPAAPTPGTAAGTIPVPIVGNVGNAEALAALGTGAIAAPVAGIAGLATAAGNALGVTDKVPGDVVNDVAGALTYQPRTQTGQDNLGIVTAPLHAIAGVADTAGEAVSSATGSPALGAAANTAIQTLPQLLLAKGIGSARGVVDTVRKVPDLNPATMALPELATDTVGTAMKAAPEAPPVAAAAPVAAPLVPPEPVAAAPALVPAAGDAVSPAGVLSAEDLAATAKKASGGGIGSSKAKDILAEQAAPDAETVAAAKRLGIDEHLQPDHVTTNQAYRELAQAVKSVPGSEAHALEKAGLEQVAARADRLIEDLGGSKDISTVSATVRANLEATHAKLDGQAADLYAQVERKIPKTAEAPAPATLDFLESHASDLGGAEKLSAVERKLLTGLKAEDGAPPTYAYLDRTRKEIGQALQKASGPFADSESGLLKKLYSTLSDDQAKVATEHGAFYQYQAAKLATKMRKGIEDDLASLFGKRLDGSVVSDLTGGTLALQKGDTSRFVGLISAVPKELRPQVTASGLSTVFQRNARDGALNFHSYANWYEGMQKNAQAYNALFANLPREAAAQLRDLYQVARGISKASRERIVTGRIQSIKDELQGADSLLANVYGLAQRSAKGVALEAVTSSVGLPGAGLSAGLASALTKGKPSVMKAADALISSPEFIAAARAQGKAQKTAINKLAHSPSFNAFVRAAGKPAELERREHWILQSLQANNGPKK